METKILRLENEKKKIEATLEQKEKELKYKPK